MRRNGSCDAGVGEALGLFPAGGGTKAAFDPRMLTRMFLGLFVSGMLVGCFAEHRPRVVQATYAVHCPQGYYYADGNCYERHPVRPVRAIVVEVTPR
jgi:hypothetical protein